VVESVRLPGAKHPVQRPLLYLGELNDSQQAAWSAVDAALVLVAHATQRVHPRTGLPVKDTCPLRVWNGFTSFTGQRERQGLVSFRRLSGMPTCAPLIPLRSAPPPS
jgi:hypothetical protein